MWCVCVRPRSLDNEKALAHWGMANRGQKSIFIICIIQLQSITCRQVLNLVCELPEDGTNVPKHVAVLKKHYLCTHWVLSMNSFTMAVYCRQLVCYSRTADTLVTNTVPIVY
jgi:hypothetical protein